MGYSYRPGSLTTYKMTIGLTTLNHKSVRFRLSVGIFLLLFLIIGIVITRIITQATYLRQTSHLPTDDTMIIPAYTQSINQRTDTTQIAKAGEQLLAKGMPKYAAINFARASDLDKNSRDLAYAWAFSLVKAKGNNLTSGDLKNIKTALARGEAIDPFYIPLLQLKLLLAQAEHDVPTIEAIQERLRILGQNP